MKELSKSDDKQKKYNHLKVVLKGYGSHHFENYDIMVPYDHIWNIDEYHLKQSKSLQMNANSLTCHIKHYCH